MEKNTEMLINSKTSSLAMAAKIEASSTSMETERNVDESVGTSFDAAIMQLKQTFLDCGYAYDI